MTSAVLDASAVIALLKGERGAGEVAALVADAAMSVFNHAEVVSHFVHLGAPIDEIRAMLGAMPYRLMPADEALACEAGALRSKTGAAGLSLGDRFCLALAMRLDVPACTADRAWKDVADVVGAKVLVIR